MTPLLLANFIFLALTLGTWWLRGELGGSHSFWRLVARIPDEAYAWFLSDPAWVVLDSAVGLSGPPGPKDRCVGPFQLAIPKLQWRTVQIYGTIGTLQESQRQFLNRYGGSWRAPRPKFALLLLLWPITNMVVLSELSKGAEGTTALLGNGLTHLGYLLLVAAIFVGRFGVFGLKSRVSTFAAAAFSWLAGVVLLNW